MTEIGEIRLTQEIPRIVAVVVDFIEPKYLKELSQQGVTIIEVRVDYLDGDDKAVLEYLKSIRNKTDFGIIGTIRENDQNRENRLDSFRTLMKGFDCVDIELDAGIIREVIASAHQAKTKVLVSHHDYKITPSAAELDSIVTESNELGADLIKIAVMANDQADVTNLLNFTATCPQKNLVTISMGSIGTISRYIAPLFGSLMTYGYIQSPIAPGQVRISRLHQRLRQDCAAYNEDFVIENEVLEAV